MFPWEIKHEMDIVGEQLDIAHKSGNAVEVQALEQRYNELDLEYWIAKERSE